MQPEKTQILQQPIERLNLSSDCKSYLRKLGFHDLKNVLEKKWSEFQQMEGFDYIMFNELIRFLDNNNLIYLMEK